jgi:hypothetical protein
LPGFHLIKQPREGKNGFVYGLAGQHRIDSLAHFRWVDFESPGPRVVGFSSRFARLDWIRFGSADRPAVGHGPERERERPPDAPYRTK